MKNKHNHFLILLLVLMTLAVFWPVFSNGFVAWDDDMLIYANPRINPVTVKDTVGFWLAPYQGLYMPLTYTLWAFEALIARKSEAMGSPDSLNPLVFHVGNLVLHLLGALVVFGILRILIKRGSDAGATGIFRREDLAAGIGAALFLVHPVQVESVAWATGTKDVLGGALSLAAVWQYLRYAQRTGDPATACSAKRSYALGVIAFALALLAKPNAVAVPLVAFVLDIWGLQRTVRQSVRALIGWAVAVVPFIIIAKLIQPSEQILFTSPIWARPLIAGDALAFYLSKLFLPIGLTPDYGRTPEFVLSHGWIYLSWLVPCALVITAWRWRNRGPCLATSGVFITGLLPVLGFIPFVYQNTSTVADRYMYVPMLAPAIAVGWLVSRWRNVPVLAVCSLLLVCLGVLTGCQARYWSDTQTLFRYALGVNPRSHVAHNILGVDLAGQGRIDEAIAHYRKAIAIKPDYARSYNNLGVALAAQGRVDEAMAEYSKVLELDPRYAAVHINLGNILLGQGKLGEAVREYEKAVKLNPEDAGALNNLGSTLLRLGKPNEAFAYLSRALAVSPGFPQAHVNMGDVLLQQGKADDSITHYYHAVRINPDLPEVHLKLARLLEAQGSIDRAVEEYREAARVNPGDVEAHYRLANILFKQQQLDEAAQEYSKALKIRPDLIQAHNNLAVVLYLRGDYAGAWQEVKLCRRHGRELHPAFLKALSDKMPEP